MFCINQRMQVDINIAYLLLIQMISVVFYIGCIESECVFSIGRIWFFGANDFCAGQYLRI